MDENRDILKSQKNIWNKKKKTYQKVLVDADGQWMDGKEKLKMKSKENEHKLQKKFKSWKK